MKWMEIIELRSSGNTRKQLETHMQEFIEQVEKNKENQPPKTTLSRILEPNVNVVK